MKIDEDLIFLNQQFSDCEACIRFIGEQMVTNNIATPAYTEAMLAVAKHYPGAIVLDDGIALAHARPEQGVLQPGLVFVQLATPVDFYNEEFPMVDFVIGLATTASDQHLQQIQALAVLIDKGVHKRKYQTKADLIHFIKEVSLC